MTIYTPDGNIIIDAPVSKSAVVKRELMGDYYIELPFHHKDILSIPIGSYVRYEDCIFEIMHKVHPERLKDANGYAYPLKFYARQHKMQKRRVFWRSSAVKEATFNLTTTLSSFAQLIADNMNATFTGAVWSVGQLPDNDADATKKMQFNGNTCWEAIDAIAKLFEVEWWITEKGNGKYISINFGKLATGDYEEFREGDVVTSFPAFKGEDENYGTRFFVYGGSRNIPADYYESEQGGTTNHISEKRLHLPNSQAYIDVRDDLASAEIVEQIVFLDEIFPKNTETITEVKTVDRELVEGETNKAYVIVCADSPFIPTDDNIIDGIISAKFTSGSLIGREFELTGYGKGVNFKQEYELVAQTESAGGEDVIIIPNEYLKPAVGDTFVLTGVKLPSARITEAENELLEAGQKYAIEHSTDTNIYDCPTNPVYCQQNDKNYSLGQKVRLMGGIFGETGRASRIQGYDKKLWNPYEATYRVGDNRRFTRYGAISLEVNTNLNRQLTPLTALTASNESNVLKAERFALQTQTSALEAKKQGEKLSTTIGSVDDKENSIYGRLYQLSNRLTKVEENTGTTDLTALKTQVETNTSNIVTLGNRLSQSETKLVALETTQSTQGQMLVAIKTDVTNIDERVTNVEKRVAVRVVTVPTT